MVYWRYITSLFPCQHLAGFAVSPAFSRLHLILPAVTIDDYISDISDCLLVVQLQNLIHELLERGCGSMEAERHGYKLVQAKRDREGHF